MIARVRAALSSAPGVLLVGALPPPAGGVATHCQELARALRAGGARVELIDPRRRQPGGRGGRLRLLAHLARARLRGDLVHLHTNGHNARSWQLAALCGAAGAPALLTLHSGLAPDFVRSHNKLVRRVCAAYASVIAVNPEIEGALVAAGVPPPRVAVLPAFTPTALSFRLAPPGLAALRRRHRPLVACALAPGPEYGAAVMLDAFARLRLRAPDAGLVLYGPETRTPALAAAARARGLDGAVHFLGELPRERALAVQAACDVFARPTLADGDAISVREALALGRPVVASRVGVRPAGVRLFPAGDAASCAELLFHAVGQRLPDHAPSLGRTARAPADCLPALLAIYSRLGRVTTRT